MPLRFVHLDLIPYGIRYSLRGGRLQTEKIWRPLEQAAERYGIDLKKDIVKVAGYGRTDCIIPPKYEPLEHGSSYMAYTQQDHDLSAIIAALVQPVLLQAEALAETVLRSDKKHILEVLVTGSHLRIGTPDDPAVECGIPQFTKRQIVIGSDLVPKYLYCSIFRNPALGGYPDRRFVQLSGLSELMEFVPDADTEWAEIQHTAVSMRIGNQKLFSCSSRSGGFHDLDMMNRACRLGQYFIGFDRFFAFENKNTLKELLASLAEGEDPCSCIFELDYTLGRKQEDALS